MIGQELKIIFRQDEAFLTTGKPLTLGQLGLPNIAKTFNAPAYWLVKVLNFSENEKKIFCEIISYNVGNANFGIDQINLADKLINIQTIRFKDINTPLLLKSLSGPSGHYLPVKDNSRDKAPIDNEEYLKDLKKVIINESFYIQLQNVHFKAGGVQFSKKFKAHNQPLELTIINNDIREEFDAIKNYFANILKTKKIEVTVNIEVAENEIKLINVKSPEIDKINMQLIECVKFEFLKSTYKKIVNLEIDKCVFILDEYFNNLPETNFKYNTFFPNEMELFGDLLSITNTKHYNHLRFLSKKHSHKIMKLRFVNKPFSFLFLIEGIRNYHFVWETLNTKEATYIWHIAKDKNVLKFELLRIEEIIKATKVTGKNSYIGSKEDNFNRIYHDYTDQSEGFLKWKSEIDSFLL